jgi:hypothetical protein
MVLHFKATAPHSGTHVSMQLAAVPVSGAALPPTNQQPLTLVISP